MTLCEIYKYASALTKEKTIFDSTNHIAYIPDVNDEGHWYGIQMFYLKDIDKAKDIIDDEGITQLCLGYIPAPAAACGSEYGYSSFVSFDYDDYSEEQDEIARSLLAFVISYLESNDDAEYEIRED